MPERIKVSAIAILIAGIATLISSIVIFLLNVIPLPPNDFIFLLTRTLFYFVCFVATPVIIGGLFLFGLSKEKGTTDKEFVLIGILLWILSTIVPITVLAGLWNYSYG